MHALSLFSSQLLVSVLFMVVPTNAENSIFFLMLVCVLLGGTTGDLPTSQVELIAINTAFSPELFQNGTPSLVK